MRHVLIGQIQIDGGRTQFARRARELQQGLEFAAEEKVI